MRNRLISMAIVLLGALALSGCEQKADEKKTVESEVEQQAAEAMSEVGTEEEEEEDTDRGGGDGEGGGVIHD